MGKNLTIKLYRCNADCSAIESGYECPFTSAPYCRKICGDGIYTDKESCDDGNKNNLDGCNYNCVTETGWTCQHNYSS